MQIHYHIALIERSVVTNDLKFTVNQRKVYRKPNADEELWGIDTYDIEGDFSKYIYKIGESLYIQGHYIVNDKYIINDIIRSLFIDDFSNSTMYVIYALIVKLIGQNFALLRLIVIGNYYLK